MMGERLTSANDMVRLVNTAELMAPHIGPIVVEGNDGSAMVYRKADGAFISLPSDPIERLTVLDNFEDKDGGFYS